MYKVYFETRTFAICDSEKEALCFADSVISYCKRPDTLRFFLEQFIANKEIEHFFLVCDDTSACIKAFESTFRNIYAGGGVVRKNSEEALMIYRRGKWDLPKGKQEPGETAEKCAVREVMEETGLDHISIRRQLCITHHTYMIDGQTVLKHITWFEMECMDGKLTPQEEEGITKAVWMDKAGILKAMENTYGSVKDVLVSATC